MYKIPAITLFTGKNLIFVPECRSTNDLALQLCQQSTTLEGTVVITSNQTAGRGQRGNVWETEGGKNLTLSVVLRPNFLQVQQQFYLNIAISTGICDYLTEILPLKVQIKWPNDIIINDKKVSGILIENQISSHTIAHSVVGIGLNVNQLNFAHPHATSLALMTGQHYDLNHQMELLLAAIERRYLQLRHHRLLQLEHDYRQALYRRNEYHPYDLLDGRRIYAKITGVDEGGRLIVDDGERNQFFDNKEIKYVL